MEEKSNNDTDNMSSSSNLSNVLIGILLIVVAFLAFNFFQAEPSDTSENIANSSETETDNDTENNQNETTPVENDTDSNAAIETPQTEYLVEQGDSLWKIAERELNNGYLWTEIASVNDISQDSANSIEPGTYLRIPVVSGANSEQSEKESTTNQIHIVTKGESLWSIANYYYGDGFSWNRIYDLTENDINMYTSLNGITYPLIEEGDVLVIPAVPVS